MSDLAKNAVLWSIARGLHLPQTPIDRINELSFLRDLLANLRIDCVLDVGANRGQFATELRRIGYEGLVISFEPIGSEFTALKARFAGDRLWQGHQLALGSVEETREITIPKLTVLSSFLEPVMKEKDTRVETISIRRLDAMLPEILQDQARRRIFLKMDTQGFDLEVFKGATGCLDRIFGIQSELSVQPLYKGMPHYLEALSMYEGAGFDLHNLTVVSRTDSGGLLEMNCFMRRPERA